MDMFEKQETMIAVSQKQGSDKNSTEEWMVELMMF